MPAGRPPKPVEQHIKEGTYRKGRHGGTLVVTTPGYGIAHLGPPPHLTAFQQDVWVELAHLLEAIVRESDAPMVEGAAVAFCQYRTAQEILDAEGMVVHDHYGNVKEHPMLRASQRSMKMYMDFSARLGLSPADRTRLGINIGNLHKTAGQMMAERFGEDEIIEDAGQEPDLVTDAELGYEPPDEV